MKNFQKLSLALLALFAITLFTACDEEDSVFGTSIGDYKNGGIVFYIDEDGHGLVCSTEYATDLSQSEAEEWAWSYEADGNEDWRLPTIREAEYLMNIRDEFSIPSDWHWSSSVLSQSQGYCWGLYPYFRKMNTAYHMPHSAFAVSEF